MVWVRVRLRDVLAPANKEGTDHAKNDITLGEMIVNEGLAENFATFLYGEDKAGPWVTKTDIETLNEYIKPIIRDGLNVQGLENLNAYLYGDEMAALQNYPQVGFRYSVLLHNIFQVKKTFIV